MMNLVEGGATTHPSPPTRQPTTVHLTELENLVRAERRVLDAEAEFDAALAAGLGMPALVARDQEWSRAVVARDALL